MSTASTEPALKMTTTTTIRMTDGYNRNNDDSVDKDNGDNDGNIDKSETTATTATERCCDKL